jgi:hypothetical protein
MDSAKKQPAFWLEVKEDYVIENFEKLVNYLRLYNYDPADEPADGDFEKSYLCLKAVADRLIDRLCQASCQAAPDMGLDMRLAARVIAAALLAGHKRGTDDRRALAALIHMSIINGGSNSPLLRSQLLRQLFCCAKGYELSRLGIGWDDVSGGSASAGGLAFKLASTTWRTRDAAVAFYEGRGMVALDGDRLIVSPMNRDRYAKSSVACEISLPVGIDYVVPAADKSKGLVTSRVVIDRLRGYLRDMAAMKPSPVVRLKDYELGDEAVVRVTRVAGIKIEAESTDPRYNPAQGNVYIPSLLTNVSREDFLAVIKPGDLLLTRVNGEDPRERFAVTIEIFDEFYGDVAVGSEGRELDAVYRSDYRVGTQWFTENGLVVNIYSRKLGLEEAESLKTAVSDGSVVVVKVLNAVNDKNDHMVINADFCPYSEPERAMSSDSFCALARQTLVRQFVQWSASDVTLSDSRDTVPLDPYYVTVINHLLVRIADDAGKTVDRVKTLTVAALLAFCRGAEVDLACLRHKLEFIGCLVKFAAGESVREVSLTHGPELDTVVSVGRDEAVVEALRAYEYEADRVGVKPSTADRDETLDNIRLLINASNVLLGKINAGEISRIKMAIVDCLEVSDEFIPVSDDATYYGIESDTLEFKSSVVFPPRNHQSAIGIVDPDQQKWAILNAVCGFLNSSCGGDLLVGVKDNGYSCGLRDDISRLFAMGRIPRENADGLRLYVKALIDQAFKATDGSAVGPEVTAVNVSCNVETNAEEHEILRVKVTPYPVLVEYREKSRPDWVAESYVRTSGSTLAMTDRLREKLTILRSRRSRR